MRRVRIPSERIEKSGGIHADLGVGGHEPEVGVEPCRPVVIVARGKVHVASYPLGGAADHQQYLRVRIVPANTVDHEDTGPLELLYPLYIQLLVESRQKLHEDSHLFATF